MEWKFHVPAFHVTDKIEKNLGISSEARNLPDCSDCIPVPDLSLSG